jgi:hypothetical protein
VNEEARVFVRLSSGNLVDTAFVVAVVEDKDGTRVFLRSGATVVADKPGRRQSARVVLNELIRAHRTAVSS